MPALQLFHPANTHAIGLDHDYMMLNSVDQFLHVDNKVNFFEDLVQASLYIYQWPLTSRNVPAVARTDYILPCLK